MPAAGGASTARYVKRNLMYVKWAAGETAPGRGVHQSWRPGLPERLGRAPPGGSGAATYTRAVEIAARASDTEGWDRSRWQVTPLAPPGPVELTIHLGGNSGVTGTGHLDGRFIAGTPA